MRVLFFAFLALVLACTSTTAKPIQSRFITSTMIAVYTPMKTIEGSGTDGNTVLDLDHIQACTYLL